MQEERFPFLEDLKVRGQNAMSETRRTIADMRDTANEARRDARSHLWRMAVVAGNEKKLA